MLNSTIANLAGSQLVFTPQTTVGGPLAYLPPRTLDFSFGVQHDLGKGFVMDIAFVGNIGHHQFNQGNIDLNAVAPLTDWTPTANNGSPGPVTRFLDPTSSNGGTGGFYNTNLLRALGGAYPGWGGIQQYTQNGESHYDALQAQFNKRVGRGFHFGSNYTWSKTLVYSRQQWDSDKLNENIAGGTRPQAVNINWGYTVPNGSNLWKNALTKQVMDGWHIEGIMTFYYGTPLTISCSANGAPIGYWTGTPTGGLPFRCQQNGPLFLPAGATPASVGSTAPSNLWYNFNAASFSLPAVNSLGIGNTPPTLTYGPGVENVDLSLYKEWRIFRETNILTLKFEAFNALNHFNPSNPNSSLALNYSNGVNTNANFGTITSAALPARHGVETACPTRNVADLQWWRGKPGAPVGTRRLVEAAFQCGAGLRRVDDRLYRESLFRAATSGSGQLRRCRKSYEAGYPAGKPDRSGFCAGSAIGLSTSQRTPTVMEEDSTVTLSLNKKPLERAAAARICFRDSGGQITQPAPFCLTSSKPTLPPN